MPPYPVRLSRVLWTRHITNTNLLVLIMRLKSSFHCVPTNILFCNSQTLYLVIVSDNCSLLSTINGSLPYLENWRNNKCHGNLWTLNPRDDQDDNTVTWAYLDTMFVFPMMTRTLLNATIIEVVPLFTAWELNIGGSHYTCAFFNECWNQLRTHVTSFKVHR
jgi:hypothetical protein